MLDLDGRPQPLITRTDPLEADVTIGADRFSYTAEREGFKLGEQV